MNIKAIAISQDGSKIVLGSFAPAIICLDNRSMPIWVFAADNGVIGVAVSRDGGYVAGNSRTSVYLLGRYGDLRWRYRSNESINAVSMDGEGRYVVAAGKEHLYLFNAEGTILWVLDSMDLSPAKEPEKVSMSKDGEYIVFNTEDKLVFMNKGKEKLWIHNISSIHSLSLDPDGDHIAVGRIDPLSGSSVSYYRTVLQQPAKTPAPVQTPPLPVSERASPEEKDGVEKQGLELERQAQEVEKQRFELELERAKQNISAVATSPPSAPVQSRSVCGPISILLFTLFPFSCRCLSKRRNRQRTRYYA